jgi:hypothetical protein
MVVLTGKPICPSQGMVAMLIDRKWMWKATGICLFLACVRAAAFQSFQGPVLANSGTATAEFEVVQHNGAVKSLGEVQSGMLLGLRDAAAAGTIHVRSDGHEFELDEAGRLRQAGDLKSWHQTWVFDGERVCVLESRVVKDAAAASCAKFFH